MNDRVKRVCLVFILTATLLTILSCASLCFSMPPLHVFHSGESDLSSREEIPVPSELLLQRRAAASALSGGFTHMPSADSLQRIGITISSKSARLAIMPESLVFDRIRENMVKMKSREDLGRVINSSINEVLNRTIITSLTTFLAAAALAVLGGEVLFDFTLALIIGILLGTYSSIFIASPLIFLARGRLR